MASVRIVDIREKTVPIEADMSNAFINFSKMNVSGQYRISLHDEKPPKPPPIRSTPLSLSLCPKPERYEYRQRHRDIRERR